MLCNKYVGKKQVFVVENVILDGRKSYIYPEPRNSLSETDIENEMNRRIQVEGKSSMNTNCPQK